MSALGLCSVDATHFIHTHVPVLAEERGTVQHVAESCMEITPISMIQKCGLRKEDTNGYSRFCHLSDYNFDQGERAVSNTGKDSG